MVSMQKKQPGYKKGAEAWVKNCEIKGGSQEMTTNCQGLQDLAFTWISLFLYGIRGLIMPVFSLA